jgi:cytochrome c553
MKIRHRPLLCLALAALLPALATAQAIPADQPYGTARDLFKMTVDTPPDADTLARGQAIALQGAGDVQSCVTCHSVDGQGDGSGSFPRLTGQPAWYLDKQLDDYASDARPDDLMTPVAQSLSEDDRAAVSAYYASLAAPLRVARGQVSVQDIQKGAAIARAGSPDKGLPACTNCHGPDGTGNPPSVPYLAGQYANYMVLQLDRWKRGQRDNDVGGMMSAIARKMTAEDMRAISEYYERVANPLTTKDPQ